MSVYHKTQSNAGSPPEAATEEVVQLVLPPMTGADLEHPDIATVPRPAVGGVPAHDPMGNPYTKTGPDLGSRPVSNRQRPVKGVPGNSGSLMALFNRPRVSVPVVDLDDVVYDNLPGAILTPTSCAECAQSVLYSLMASDGRIRVFGAFIRL